MWVSSFISHGPAMPRQVPLPMVKLGQEVATSFDGMHQPGTYEAIFNGGGLASSIYLNCLTTNDLVETKKSILLR
jgi:hypothetical protein